MTVLSQKTVEELQKIMDCDYGVAITDSQAQELGVSLLRLTRVAISALARADKNRLSVEARERISLEPKTSS
jgi:hypothetical protein